MFSKNGIYHSNHLGKAKNGDYVVCTLRTFASKHRILFISFQEAKDPTHGSIRNTKSAFKESIQYCTLYKLGAKKEQ